MSNIFKKLGDVAKIAGRSMDKHSPEILIACGVVGFISTVVLVAKEAPIVKERLEELHEELAEREEEPKKSEVIFEEVKAAAPVYLPAIVSGGMSIACVLCAFKIKNRRTAALATAYEITQASFNDYQNKVRERLGEKKEKQLRDDIAQDKVNENPPIQSDGTNNLIITDGLSLFYDSYCGRYFRSSVDIIRKAEKEISDRLPVEMWCSLNDFYSMIDVPSVKLGDDIGFNVDMGINISFSSTVLEGTPILVLDYTCGPRFDYRGYGPRW